MSEAPRAIYKYSLNGGSTLQPVNMPVGAEILKLGIDPNGALCLWALVDPFETVTNSRTFEVIGTGWNFNPTGKTYLDTIFASQLVWHIWEHV